MIFSKEINEIHSFITFAKHSVFLGNTTKTPKSQTNEINEIHSFITFAKHNVFLGKTNKLYKSQTKKSMNYICLLLVQNILFP